MKVAVLQQFLEFAVGDRAHCELRNRSLPNPKQENHERQIPQRKFPLWKRTVLARWRRWRWILLFHPTLNVARNWNFARNSAD